MSIPVVLFPSHKMSTYSIIALCASHIDSAQRAVRFLAMIDSVRRQTLPCTLVVSMSFEPDAPELLRNILLSCQSKNVIIHVRPQPLKQFEHYATLANISQPQQWICFTDDDDQWHPQRIECMTGALKEREKYTIDKPLSCIRVTNKGTKPAGFCEYVECLCTSDIFKSFFHVVPSAMLRFDYCDLLFGTLLRHNQNRSSLIISTNIPLYRYDDDESYPRMTNKKSKQFNGRTGLRSVIFENAGLGVALNPSITRQQLYKFLEKSVQCSNQNEVNVVRKLTKDLADEYWASEQCCSLRQTGLALLYLA